jgi:PilZ domain
MDATSEPFDNSPEPIKGQARRHERIYEPFPVMICGRDASGEAFEIYTVLDNFSAGGFYVRLERRIEPGTRLFAIVRLSTFPPEVPAPRVAVRGVVLRVEPQPDGTCGVAVRFTRHRFL